MIEVLDFLVEKFIVELQLGLVFCVRNQVGQGEVFFVVFYRSFLMKILLKYETRTRRAKWQWDAFIFIFLFNRLVLFFSLLVEVDFKVGTFSCLDWYSLFGLRGLSMVLLFHKLVETIIAKGVSTCESDWFFKNVCTEATRK